MDDWTLCRIGELAGMFWETVEPWGESPPAFGHIIRLVQSPAYTPWVSTVPLGDERWTRTGLHVGDWPGDWCARLCWSAEAIQAVAGRRPDRMLAWLTEGAVPYPGDVYSTQSGGTITAEIVGAMLQKVYEDGLRWPSQELVDYWQAESDRLVARYLTALEREYESRGKEVPTDA